MKKLLVIVACLILAACGEDNIVDIDIRGDVFFFGSLEIQKFSKEEPFSYARIMLADSKGGLDVTSVNLNMTREGLENQCLLDTEILLNDKKLQPITVKSEENDKKLSYRVSYSFEEYLEFMEKNNKVMVSSCGIKHILTDNEKVGLAKITEAWSKFKDNK